MLSWSIGQNAVDINGLSYVAGQNKTLRATVNNAVYALGDTLGGTKTASYIYFGFCTCGIEAPSRQQAGFQQHQCLLDNNSQFRTVGPENAGKYWLVMTITGGDSQNYEFVDEGYADPTHFTTQNGNTYLTWYNNPSNLAITTPLPADADNNFILNFNVARSPQGFISDNPTEVSLTFTGAYFLTSTGLPTVQQGIDVRVQINGVEYTYNAYNSATAAIIRNAGVYELYFYEASASGNTTISCNLFSSDAVLEANILLTVHKATINIEADEVTIDGAAAFWQKVYDKTTDFTTYTTGASDILPNTSVTIKADYDSYNAGNRYLTFILSGADAGNYKFAFAADGTDLVEEDDYFVSGNSYTISSAIAKIAPRTIEVAGDTNKLYDGTDTISNINVASANILPGDVVTVSGVYAQSDVGTDIPIILTSSNPNYKISTSIATKGSILPRDLTITWTDNHSEYTYNSGLQGISVTVSGWIQGFEETLTYTARKSYTQNGTFASNMTFTAKNAGEYEVILSLTQGDNSNYSITSATTLGAWTIEKKEVAIVWTTDDLGNTEIGGILVSTWTGFTTVYCNVERSVSASLFFGAATAIDGLVYTGDELGLEVINNIYTNAGTYTAMVIALTGADAANYTLPEDTEKEWEIAKANITNIQLLPETSYVYTGNAQGIEVTAYVTQHGAPVTVVYSGGTTKTLEALNGFNAIVNAGTAYITAVVTNENYNTLTIENVTLTINKATITNITMQDRTFTYDRTYKSISVSDTFTQLNEDMSDYLSYTIEKDGVSNPGNSAMNAGVYRVTAEIQQANYNTFTLTRTLTITPKELTLTWVSFNYTGVYNKTAQGLTLTVTGIVLGDVVELTLTDNGTARTLANTAITTEASGTYTKTDASNSEYYVTVTALDNTNYALPGNLTGTWNIARAVITITGWAYTNAKVSGENYDEATLVYNKSAYTLVPTVSGVISGDDIELILSGNVETNANSSAGINYTATAGLDMNVYTNYTMEETSKSWHIWPKDVTAAWNGVYSFVYNAQEKTVNAEIGGVEEGDDVTFIYTGNKGTIVGSYLAEITGVTNANYTIGNIVNKSKAWEITKADISGITFGNAVYTYDGTTRTLTVSGNVTSYGDEVEVVYNYNTDGTSTYPLSGNGGRNANVYYIKATLTNSNYFDLALTAVLTIEKRAITVTWDVLNPVYTYIRGTTQGVTATIANIVAGDVITVEGKNGTANVNASNTEGTTSYTVFFGNVNANVNPYQASIENVLEANGNYRLPEEGLTDSYTINKKEVAIVWTTDDLGNTEI
ncbi:MAG TPA: YDG domain-containing protein, partial [Clostridia bacterium]|nr:YDG domain-containing protein [Clostridia bacterium]